MSTPEHTVPATVTRRAWSRDFPRGIVASAPTPLGVAVLDGRGEVQMVDGTTGRTLWHRSRDAPHAYGWVQVLRASPDGRHLVQAEEVSDSVIIWTLFDLRGTVIRTLRAEDLTLANDYYVTVSSATDTATGAATAWDFAGHRLWSATVDRGCQVAYDPLAVTNETVLLFLDCGEALHLQQYDRTGTLLWQHSYPGGTLLEGALAAPDGSATSIGEKWYAARGLVTLGRTGALEHDGCVDQSLAYCARGPNGSSGVSSLDSHGVASVTVRDANGVVRRRVTVPPGDPSLIGTSVVIVTNDSKPTVTLFPPTGTGRTVRLQRGDLAPAGGTDLTHGRVLPAGGCWFTISTTDDGEVTGTRLVGLT